MSGADSIEIVEVDAFGRPLRDESAHTYASTTARWTADPWSAEEMQALIADVRLQEAFGRSGYGRGELEDAIAYLLGVPCDSVRVAVDSTAGVLHVVAPITLPALRERVRRGLHVNLSAVFRLEWHAYARCGHTECTTREDMRAHCERDRTWPHPPAAPIIDALLEGLTS